SRPPAAGSDRAHIARYSPTRLLSAAPFLAGAGRLQRVRPGLFLARLWPAANRRDSPPGPPPDRLAGYPPDSDAAGRPLALSRLVCSRSTDVHAGSLSWSGRQPLFPHRPPKIGQSRAALLARLRSLRRRRPLHPLLLCLSADR